MKRKIETEGFALAAPCAPYGIWEDPSGRTGVADLRVVGSLSSAAPADEHDDGTVAYHPVAPRPRLFTKGIAYWGIFRDVILRIAENSPIRQRSFAPLHSPKPITA